MPTFYRPDSQLEGFIVSQACDFNIIVGDFKVDFYRGSKLAILLEDFMVGINLYACDLCFRPSVLYTYERDDSLVRSWLDNILCSHHSSMPISNVYSGSISSDHFPVFFQLMASCLSLPYPKLVQRDRQRVRIDWTKVSSADVENYCSLVSQSIDELPTVLRLYCDR